MPIPATSNPAGTHPELERAVERHAAYPVVAEVGLGSDEV
jgi:hypothetical protein